MNGKRNYIYLFYERVDADDKGNSQAGYKYYKCFHGQRKTYAITPNMKHNIKSKSILSFVLSHVNLTRRRHGPASPEPIPHNAQVI
jgi:hypothetical protein